MCIITDNVWVHSFLMKGTITAFFSNNFEDDNKKSVTMKKYQYLIGITVNREILEILADYGANPKPKAKLLQGDLRENYLVDFINKCGNVDEKTKNEVISHVFSHLSTDKEAKKVRDSFSVKNFKQAFKVDHKRLAGKYSVLELLMNTLLTNLTVMKTQHSLKKDDMGQCYPLTDTYKIDEADKTKAAPASGRGGSNERENYTTLYNLRPELSLRQTLQECFIKKYPAVSIRLSPEEKRKVVKRLNERTRNYTVGHAAKDLVPKKSNSGRPNSENTKRKADEQEDIASDAGTENENKPGKKPKRTKRAKSVETMDDDECSETKSAADVTLKSASLSAKRSISKKRKLEHVRQCLRATLVKNDIDSGKIAKIMDDMTVDLTELIEEGDMEGLTLVDTDDEGNDEEDDEVDGDDKAEEQDESLYDKIRKGLAKLGLKLSDFYDMSLRYSTDEYQQKLVLAIVGKKRNNKTGKAIQALEMSELFGTSSEEDNGHLENLLDCAKKAKYKAKVKMYTFTYKNDEFSLTAEPATIGDEAATNEIPILRDASNEEENGILEYFLLEKM